MIPILLAGLALAPEPIQAGEAERLRYDVAAGSVLRRDLVVRHELQFDGVTVTLTGEPPTRQDLTGWISTWFKVTLDDTLGEPGAGRPKALRRRWVDLGGTGSLKLNAAPGQPAANEQAVLSSPLRDRRVDFTWIEGESDWARLWVHDDADEFWLAEMRGDMDALGLLPAEPVAPGAEWELSMEAVRSILAPGGNHLITPRTKNVFGRTVEVGVGGDYSEVLGPELSGAARARFEGVREVEGERLAVLQLTLQGLHSIADRTDLWRLSSPPEQAGEFAQLISTLVEYSLDARGEALWSLDHNHLHSLEVSGDETYMVAVAKRGARAVDPRDVLQQSSFHGRVELTYRIAPPPPGDGPASAESPDAGRDH